MTSQHCSTIGFIQYDETGEAVQAQENITIVSKLIGDKNQQWRLCPNKDDESVSFRNVLKGLVIHY